MCLFLEEGFTARIRSAAIKEGEPTGILCYKLPCAIKSFQENAETLEQKEDLERKTPGEYWFSEGREGRISTPVNSHKLLIRVNNTQIADGIYYNPFLVP